MSKEEKCDTFDELPEEVKKKIKKNEEDAKNNPPDIQHSMTDGDYFEKGVSDE